MQNQVCILDQYYNLKGQMKSNWQFLCKRCQLNFFYPHTALIVSMQVSNFGRIQNQVFLISINTKPPLPTEKKVAQRHRSRCFTCKFKRRPPQTLWEIQFRHVRKLSRNEFANKLSRRDKNSRYPSYLCFIRAPVEMMNIIINENYFLNYITSVIRYTFMNFFN